MEFEMLFKELKKLEKDGRLEDIEVEDGTIGLYWAEYIDVEVNGFMYLVSSIKLNGEENILEIYGALGAKAFDLEEIEEFGVDV